MSFDDHKARAGWVYLVGAGPGDPGLITVRGAELLQSADVVLHDELIDPLLLADLTGEVRSVGKRGNAPASKRAAQAAINAELVAEAQAGKSVVRLKGGDPFLFGRGGEEVRALRAAAIPFEVVSGVSSPVGATAYAGIPLTDREHASSVTFVTAITRDGVVFDWSELRALSGTICVFMGTRRMQQICRGLMIDAGRDPATPAAVVQWISHPMQRTVTGTLADIADRAVDAAIGSPSLLVVGDVAKEREALRWFDTQPLFGKRVLVTRPDGQAAPVLRALRRRGAQPVAFATIAIEPPDDADAVARAVSDLGRYDLVAFTSHNGVVWFWRAIEAAGLDVRALGNARVAATGPATGAALRRRGIRADIVARTFVAEELARAILAALAPGARVLLPRALVAREVLPDTLRAAGIEVDVVPVYRTVTASGARADELRGLVANVDVIMLTSSSTVENLCELLGADARALLAHVTLASIGPVTSDTARALGLEVAVTATESTTAGLIAALEAHFKAG